MIQIDDDQLRTLARLQDQSFRLKLIRFLQENCNVDSSLESELDSGIDTALKNARSFGLRNERALAMYVVAAFRCGLTIRDDPGIQATMSSRTLSEAAKAEWLVDWLDALEQALETSDVR